MFNKDLKKEIKKGLLAFAKRTIVMLLSFMMVTQLIPFSLYDMSSYAETSEDTTSATTIQEGELFQQLKTDVTELPGDEQIKKMTERSEIFEVKGKVSYIKAFVDLYSNASKVAKLQKVSVEELSAGAVLTAEEVAFYTEHYLPILNEKLEILDSLLHVDTTEITDYDKLSGEFKSIIAMMDTLPMTEDEVNTLYFDSEIAQFIKLVTTTIPNMVAELSGEEQNIFSAAYGEQIGPQKSIHKALLARRVYIKGDPLTASNYPVYIYLYDNKNNRIDNIKNFGMYAINNKNCQKIVHAECTYNQDNGVRGYYHLSPSLGNLNWRIMTIEEDVYNSSTGRYEYVTTSHFARLNKKPGCIFIDMPDGSQNIINTIGYCAIADDQLVELGDYYATIPEKITSWKTANININRSWTLGLKLNYTVGPPQVYNLIYAGVTGTGYSFGTHPNNVMDNLQQVITIPNPSRSSYIFGGWTITGINATATIGNNIAVPAGTTASQIKDTTFANLAKNNDNVTFTATWLKSVSKPNPAAASLTFTYDGTEKSVPTYTNVINIGDTKAVAGGTYTARYVPEEGYCWPDGTVAPVEKTWTINKLANPMHQVDQIWNVEASDQIQETPFTGLADAQGDITYSALTSVTTDASSYFSINGKNLRMAANTPKGTHEFTVTGTTAGTQGYASSTLTFNVTVNVDMIPNPIKAPANQNWNPTFNTSAQTMSSALPAFIDPVGTVTYGISDVINSFTGATLAAKNYFSINDSNKLQMAANTPVGTYVVYVKGTASGDATYGPGSDMFKVTVTVDKNTNPITKSGSDKTATFEYSKTDKSATVTFPTISSAQGAVTYSVSEVKKKSGTTFTKTGNYFKTDAANKLEMAGKTPLGTYEVTVNATAAGNDNYKPGSVSFKITVEVTESDDLVITPTPYVGTYDENEHVAKIKSNVPDVVVEYGLTTDYDYSLELKNADQDYELDRIKVTNPGEYKVYYKVEEPGYQSKTGDFTIKINDDEDPELGISATHNFASEQAVTLTASDNYKVAKYYFGTDSDQEPTIAEDIVNGALTKTVNIDKPDTYYFKVADGAGRIVTKSIKFYETKLEAIKGTIPEPTKILIASGDSFELPEMTPITGMVESKFNAWKITETGETLDKCATYTPKGNYTLINEAVGEMEVTATAVTAEANGLPHAAKIKSNLEGVTVYYGYTPECTDGYIEDLGTASVKMEHASRTDFGQTIVYYTATKEGFETIKGSTTVNVIDRTKPTSTIKNVTHTATETQTATLSANDIGKIKYWYFGTEKNPSADAFHELETPVVNFEKELAEISGSGTHYFIVKDIAGLSDTSKIYMVNVEIDTENGSASTNNILVEKGVDTDLPTAIPDYGYEPLTEWTFDTLTESGDEGEVPIIEHKTIPVDGKLNVTTNGILKGKFADKTATLSYDNNGLGGATQEAQTMYFSKEATAAPALENIPGYTFKGWSTRPNGTGTFYEAGAIVKGPEVVPEDTILYAKWEANKIEFANQEFTITTSENAQTVEVSGASNGTGSYTYSLQKQPTGNYFDVSADGTITIAARTPAKTYTVMVQAKDNETGKVAIASIKFNVGRMTGELSLASSDVEMLTLDTKTIGFDCTSNATVVATSDNIDVETYVSENSVIVKSNDKKGEATITVKAPQTEIYTEDSKELHIKVNNRKLKVTGIDVVASADDQPHAARISSEFDDVDVRYGISESNLNHLLNIPTSNDAVDLVDEAITEVGEAIIYFRASKPGYDDVTGNAKVTVTDGIDATGTITEATTEFADHQTVTLTASDNSKIVGFYFGKDENGEPQDIQEAVKNFKKENVAVASGEGMYYFRVKDKGGHITTVAKMMFYNTSFEVEHGVNPFDTPILIASGDSFALPEVVASEGYTAVDKWLVSGDATEVGSKGDTYKVEKSQTLVASCTENTATLTYNINEHGAAGVSVSDQPMKYTATAEAAEAISAEAGYTFVAWNTKVDGTGKTFEPGDPVKNAFVDPEDIELFAIWSNNKLIFNSKRYNDLSTSDNAQTVDIIEASAGSGNYEYSVIGQTDENYFKVVEGNKIEIKAKTPAGQYTVSVKAKDTTTDVEAIAVYKLTLSRIDPVLKFVSSAESMTTQSEITVDLDQHTDGQITVETSNPEIAKASLNGNSVVIQSFDITGDAVITVKSAKTGVYNEESTTCNINVINQTFNVTPIDVTANADGLPHAAKISCDAVGVEIRYGVNGKFDHVLKTESENAEVELVDESRTDLETITINYIASKPGCDTITGTVKLAIVDTTDPTGTITDSTTNLTDKQTVTLTASDNSKVKGYYFGQEENGVPTDLDEPVRNFQKIKVDVASGDGMYYFRVEDMGGNIKTVATLEFFNTSFEIENGANPFDTPILIASGDSFTLPEIVEDYGYTNTPVTEWTVSSDGRKLGENTEYAPVSTETLKVSCIENTKTLSYDINEHGAAGVSVSDQPMKYTATAEAAPEISGASGYAFKEWNTKSDGTGKPYNPGDVVKGANVDPVDTVLYAIWTTNTLVFNNQTISCDASEDAQTIPITLATGGSDNYKYEVMDNNEYFSIVDNSKILVKEETPANQYTVTIKVTDLDTSAETTAVYKITVNKLTGVLEFGASSGSMDTHTTKTVAFNKVTNGTPTVESNNPNVATAVLSGESIIITSYDVTGNATITVDYSETGVYTAVSDTYDITVANRTFNITETDVTADANGLPHAAYLTSDTDGIEVRYGLKENDLDHLVKIESKNTPVALSAESRTEISDITIYYRASKAGYEDVTGSVKLVVIDSDNPEGRIYDETKNVADHQTVKLEASDTDKIVGYYFGKDASGVPEDLVEPVKNLSVEDVSVASGDGWYYFIVKDTGNHTVIADKMMFYNTKFVVTNGSAKDASTSKRTKVENVLIASGDGYYLPEIVEDYGYTDTQITEWTLSGDATKKYTEKTMHYPHASEVLTASCVENTATLKYHENVHGLSVPGDQPISFNATAEAAEAISGEPGYVFVAWNTQPGGSGATYLPGDVVKEAGVDSDDIDLYAIWKNSTLEFENKTFNDLFTSEDAQYVPIKEATGGSGYYKYEIAGQTDENYFEVTGNSKVRIKEGTPAGKYTLSLKVTDTVTSAESTAVYKFELTRIAGSLTISSEETMLTIDEKVINFTKHTDGALSVDTDNAAVATASLSGDSVIVKSKEITGDAIITVTAAKSGIFNEVSASCHVKVTNRTFEVTPIDVTANADGLPHAAMISSDSDNVTVRYGVDGKYNHVVKIDTPNVPVALSAESRTEAVDSIVINYIASRPTCEDIEGTVNLAIVDTTDPTGTITDSTTNIADHQTVTLTASDNSRVWGYYFGQEANGTPVELGEHVRNFKKEKVDVASGDGMYYFRVQDMGGNIKTVAELEFYNTSFDAINGVDPYDMPILIASGDSFTMPAIVEDYGYTDTHVDKWTVSGDASQKVAENTTYYPNATKTFIVDCIENTATLSYNMNLYGAESISDQPMKFTATAEAAEAMKPQTGYTFKCWNTEADGTGKTYNPGDVVKKAFEDVDDIELFAIWTVNELEFNEFEDKNMFTSESAQYVPIKEATGGSGHYKYSVSVQTDENYFSISDNSKLRIKEGTPSGQYTVTLKATDTVTSAEAIAIYKLKLTKLTGNVTLKKDSVSMTGEMTTDVEFTKFTNGELSVETTNGSIASASIAGNKIQISSKGNPGTATLTLRSAMTPVYTAASDTIEVTVTNQSFTVDVDEDSYMQDGMPHMVKMHASIDDVTVYYGTSEDALDRVKVIGTEPIELDGITRTEPGSTTIYYRATKPGYADVKDQTDLYVQKKATEKTADYEATEDFAKTQTLKFTIRDDSEISAYYFGTKLSGEMKSTDYTKIEKTDELIVEKEVASEGHYYFRYQDGRSKPRTNVPIEIDFYRTTFSVDNGTTTIDYVITESGKDIELPVITADDGFDAVSVWNDGTTDCSAGAKYTVTANKTMKATCVENTTTLKYDGNEHGITSADSQDMRYTVEVTAAPAISGEAGYTFKYWNTKPNGKGKSYVPGDTVKRAGEALDDTILYAIWTVNPITFASKSFTKDASENAQTVAITGAEGGSDHYSYEVVNNKDYFSISDDSKIEIAGWTPSGEYTVTVKATDTVTGAESTAVYKFKIDRISASLTLDSNAETIKTNSTKTVGFTKHTDGEITVETSNPAVATVALSDDEFVITSNDITGNATITVKIAASEIYNGINATCNVTVTNQTFTITPIDVTADANGTPHAAKIKSDIGGVRVRYGLGTNLNHVIDIDASGEAVELVDESRTEVDTITINYVASKAGYADVTGSVKLAVIDSEEPTGTITEATKNLTDKQTVTLTASDNSAITGFYFGKDENGTPNDLNEAVKVFKREKVDVANGEGTYFFRVKDTGNHVITVATLEFFATTFEVTNGTTTVTTPVLIASGDSFSLPTFAANEGYEAPDKWTVAGTEEKLAPTTEYAPNATKTLTVSCTEKTATLSYNGNGHAVTTAESQTMSYSQEATAAPALTGETGFSFVAWNTKADGTGATYVEGDIVKPEGKIPEDTTLYAIWAKNTLTFASKSFTKDASENAQAVAITEATGGSGEYTYEVMNNEEYFSVSGDSEIVIKGSTPAGKYTVTVKALDKKTDKEATAVYRFEINKLTGSLTLASSDVSMLTHEPKTVKISMLTDVEFDDLTVESDNPSVATAVVSGDSLVITSKDVTGDANITVKLAETGIYTGDTASCNVTVNNRKFSISVDESSSIENGTPHTVKMSSDADDVTVYYGEDEDAPNCVITVGKTAVGLNGVTRTEEGQTTIYYRATKPGYDDVKGSAIIDVIYGEWVDPELDYTVTNNASDKQTIKITLTEMNTGITSYYWGPKEIPNPLKGKDYTEIELTNNLVIEKEVSEEGTYYFHYIDGNGDVDSDDEFFLEVVFSKTTLEVTHGSTVADYVITEDGGKFKLPEITPETGYNATTEWTDGDKTYHTGDDYEVDGNKTLTAVCPQKTATLSYNNNGHDVATADAQTMEFESATVISAEPLTGVSGYTFRCWNTSADGSGKSYKKGDVFRKAFEVPEDTTLYAIWDANEITFENQKFSGMKASIEAQSKPLTGAEHGTGDYKYEIVGQTDDNYFSISGDSIIVKAGTPAGKYTVSVKATDNDSKKTATAVYTFELEKDNASLSLSDDAVSMQTSDTKTLNFSKVTNGTVTATIDNPAIAAVTVSDGTNGTITVKSKNVTGDATVTVKTEATGIYNEITKTFSVKVTNRTFEVTGIDITKEADGTGYAASISSNADNVTVKYGTENKYDHVLTIANKNTAYKMAEVTRALEGTTTVNFIATKEGYDEVTGSATITITDSGKPWGSITEVTNAVADKQTVKLTASDYDMVQAVYFGTDASAEPIDLGDAVKNYKKENVEVTADATYYLIVKDRQGNVDTVASETFYRTTFAVEHGSPAYSSVLTKSGNEFKLPAITAANGYTAGTKWVVSGDAETVKGTPGANYKPENSLDLVAICDDLTATLTYNANGHGTAPAEVTMKYSVATTAEPAISADGYTFKEWNTKADGMGDKFQAGAIVKDANEIPKDKTLYAIWEEASLGFENQTINDVTTSENAQLVAITAPTAGFGNYTYSIENQSVDCFEISGDSLLVKAKTKAGTYVVDIKATDTKTGISAIATYTINLQKMENAFTITPKFMNIMSTLEVSANSLSDGDMTATSNKTSVVDATVSGNMIVLTSTDVTGNATITLKVAETELYKASTTEFIVTVLESTIEISAGAEQIYEMDGTAHSAVIESSVDGITFKYGTDKNNLNHILDNVVKNTPMKLVADSRTAAGTTTIFYEASKQGYKTVTGQIDLILEDRAEPVLDEETLALTGKAASQQTFTFTVSDPSKVAAYYVGTKTNPTDGDYTQIPVEKQAVEYAVKYEITEAGKQNVFVKDTVGNTLKISELFVMTEITFEVEHGTPSCSKVLAGLHFDTKTPTITPDEGYEAPEKWNELFVKCGSSFTFTAPRATAVKETCTEKTAKLTYNANGHGTAPESVTMTLSKETTAAPAMATADGYTFIEWNTSAYGNGTSYKPGDTIKKAGDTPKSVTLYAVWKMAKMEIGKARYSLTIGADLSVNFYFNIPTEYAAGKMTFKIANDSKEQVVDGYADGKNGTKFTCTLNVNQMSDKITWEYNCDGEKCTGTYKLYNYLNSVMKKPDSYSSGLVDFCKKLNAYGHYAQAFLAKSKGKDITHEVIPAPATEPGVHDFAKFETVVTGSSDSLVLDSDMSRSLILDSTISLKLNVPLKEGCTWETAEDIPNITLKNEKLKVTGEIEETKTGKRLVITIEGITIKYLNKDYTVIIGDEGTITASAMTYARRVVEKSTTESDLDKLARKFGNSLYELCESANSYK